VKASPGGKLCCVLGKGSLVRTLHLAQLCRVHDFDGTPDGSWELFDEELAPGLHDFSQHAPSRINVFFTLLDLRIVEETMKKGHVVGLCKVFA
jgi:hypothetical protein